MKTLMMALVVAAFLPGCACVEAYRIWTAEPSDGYAIGCAVAGGEGGKVGR